MEDMPKTLIVLLLVFLTSSCGTQNETTRSPSPPPSSNGEPIILVHGVAGWDRGEIPGYYYWGGSVDLQSELRDEGFGVFTAPIGPFSSNWDRACELFAYIKGGTVDYGRAHSEKFGHARFGATFRGAHPSWGPEARVHLIAHSMGGQTSRLLVHLLRNGNSTEIESTPDDVSMLFKGGGQWIKSITTLSAPHDGTTMVEDLDIIEALLGAAVSALAAMVEIELFPDIDLKVGHWGVTRHEGERLLSYFNRVRKLPVWTQEPHDFSLWDVSREGAATLNGIAAADPDVYYFSWSNEKTSEGPFGGGQIPELSMLPLFMPGAIYIGSHDSEAWRPSDGVVNTVSMRGPTSGSKDMIVDYGGEARPGVWNYMGLIPSTDHGEIIGIAIDEPIAPFYRSICELVTALE
jgi:triacylglycerol lipase